MYTWADVNNMKFNNGKFELIYALVQLKEYYTPSGESIERKVVKDLGIHFQAKLTFLHHVVATAAKGHRMAGWALWTFQSRGKQVMLTLLKTLIVSHVEYACVVWSPTDRYCINLLESVQRRFTSKMSCFLTYDEALDMPVCSTDYST